MTKESKRVNAIVDMRLYGEVMKLGFSISEAIIMGLEKLIEPPKEEKEIRPMESIAPEVLTAKDSLIQSLEVHTIDLNKRIESLKEQLKVKENGYYERIEDMKEQLKSKDENQLSRITDLKEEITLLCDQLKEKDSQIKNLTTITESQVKSYKMIEAPGAKRPWWRFW